MIRQYQTFEELTDTAAAYITGLRYSLSVVCYYQREWRHLGNYMKERGIKEYSPEVGSQYLDDVVGSMEQKRLPKSKQMRIRIVSSLSDFLATGTVRKRKPHSKPEELNGEIGMAITQYVIEAARLNGYAQSTIESHRLYLSRFLKYLGERGIDSFESFSPGVIIHFCGSLNEYSVITRHLIILKTKQFLKYLYKRGVLPVDYSAIVPKDKYVRQAKLPSYFSPEEVDNLLGSIDRSNANGRRDYAMILLVARLGLRCSDVVNMRFDNIQWEQEKLVLIQQKTKIPLELPLFPDVGNAIINYLKAGRPQSNLPYVFLRLTPPYDNMDDNAVNGIMQKYLKLSGIRYDERRHGPHAPHALRHSLAVSLLKQSIPLPVISSVLGHVNTESTLNYLRVNADSLKQCALEVSFNIQTRKEVSV